VSLYWAKWVAANAMSPLSSSSEFEAACSSTPDGLLDAASSEVLERLFLSMVTTMDPVTLPYVNGIVDEHSLGGCSAIAGACDKSNGSCQQGLSNAHRGFLSAWSLDKLVANGKCGCEGPIEAVGLLFLSTIALTV